MSAASPQRENGAYQGSLLLWLEGGVVYSINRMATLIWERLENNPNGVPLSQIVEDIGKQCQLPTDGSFREMFKRDVETLLEWFEQRGVLKKKNETSPDATYQIKGTAFRADDGPPPALYEENTCSPEKQKLVRAIRAILTPAGTDRELGINVSDQVSAINKHRSSVYTAVALLMFVAYDVAFKILGFKQLFEIIGRSHFRKRERLDPDFIQRVCAGIERARIWYPKQVMCMQHSIVTKCLLEQYGVPARLTFAARKMPFKSHAWVEVWGNVVNDTQKVRTYYKVFKEI